MIGKIILKSVSVSATTNAQGTASLSLKVPGVFSTPDGYAQPTPNGRYLKQVQIWTASGSDGDQVSNIRIEDSDLILQGLGLSGNFPNYPVIMYMQDQDITESSGVKRGLGVPVSQIIEISPIDSKSDLGMVFIPSGFYIKADFTEGSGLLSKIVRANFLWGKYE